VRGECLLWGQTPGITALWRLLGERGLRGVALAGCNSYKGNWTSAVTNNEANRAWVTYYDLWAHSADNNGLNGILPYKSDVNEVINSNSKNLGEWFDEIFGN
jgi:hypothetical protein